MIIAKTETWLIRDNSHPDFVPTRINKHFMVVVEYKELVPQGECVRHNIRTDPLWEQKLWVKPLGTLKHDEHPDRKFLLLHVTSERLYSEDDMYKTLKHHTFKFTDNNNVTEAPVMIICDFTVHAKLNGDWVSKCALKRTRQEIDPCLHKLGFKDSTD
jgi:hypothetical protein